MVTTYKDKTIDTPNYLNVGTKVSSIYLTNVVGPKTTTTTNSYVYD